MRWLDATQVQEVATPGTPAAGFAFIYPKSDHLWYGLDSTGAEKLISNKAPTVTKLTVGSGTYTLPAGCIAIEVELVGGGGGAGGVAGSATQSGASAGGSAGAYVRKLFSAPAVSYVYVVGAKGAKGTGAVNGSDATNSTFGPGGAGQLIAVGGGGTDFGALGTTAAAQSDHGSTSGSSGGDIIAEGASGNPGLRFSASQAFGGRGGQSFYGGGDRGAFNNSAGLNGSAPGSGGSGACVASVNTARAGGDGADGQITITEFY